MHRIPSFDPSDPMGPKDEQEPPWEIEQELTAFRLHHGTRVHESGAIEPVVLAEIQMTLHATQSEPRAVESRLLMDYRLAAQLSAALQTLLSSWDTLQSNLGATGDGSAKQ